MGRCTWGCYGCGKGGGSRGLEWFVHRQEKVYFPANRLRVEAEQELKIKPRSLWTKVSLSAKGMQPNGTHFSVEYCALMLSSDGADTSLFDPFPAVATIRAQWRREPKSRFELVMEPWLSVAIEQRLGASTVGDSDLLERF